MIVGEHLVAAHVYQGVTATETIAAHKFTVSRYVGYGLPDRQVEVTLGQMLGADHVEWICAQPYPAGTAGCRARGQWDCNNLEMCAAYTELERVLSATQRHQPAA